MATEFTATVKSSGGDYSSLSAAESGLQCNLTAAATLVFSHGGITGSAAGDDFVTGKTSGATGTVIAITGTQILLTVLTGTFSSGEQVYKTVDTDYVVVSDGGDSAILGIACYAMADTTLAVINGTTSNAAKYMRIYTPASERHSGVWDTGKYYLKAYKGYNGLLQLEDYHIRVEGLQVWNTASPSATTSVIDVGSGAGTSNTYISDCIVRGGGHGIYTTRQVFIWNCIVYGPLYAALWSGTSNLKVYNCTLIGNTYGWEFTTGTGQIFKNCYAKGSTAGYKSGGTLTTCASSDTSGSAGLQNIAYSTANFTNVTGGSEDLSLVSGSALIDVGTDTSGDAAPLDFTDDIDGTARGATWDVGVFEYLSSGAIAIEGSFAVTSSISGAVEVARALEGVISAVSSIASAPVKVARNIDGTISIIADVSGNLQAAWSLAGALSAASSLSATLGVLDTKLRADRGKVVMEVRTAKAVKEVYINKVNHGTKTPKIVH